MKPTRAVDWMVWNVGAAAALAVVVWADVAWLRWIYTGFTASVLVAYVAVFLDPDAKRHTRAVPAWLEAGLDFLLLALLIYAEMWAAVVMFIASLVVLAAVFKRGEQQMDEHSST